MERAPTAEDSKPEAYDETGAGARAKPMSDAEPPRENLVRQWFALRRKGWRKDPTGQGFLCPDASCKTGGDIHTRAHHDRWHQDIRDNFETTDTLIDELRAGIADRDETINIQSEEIDRINHKLAVHTEILSQIASRGVHAIVEQVVAERLKDSEP